MAISLSSLVGLNSTLPANYQHVFRSSVRTPSPKDTRITFSFGLVGSGVCRKGRRKSLCLSVADSDRLSTDTSSESPAPGNSVSDNQLSSVNPSSVDSSRGFSQSQTSNNEPGLQSSELLNGTVVSSGLKQDRRQNLEPMPKRSPLTARERLRAARVLSRYNTEPKPLKKTDSTVLDTLKESDKGKKRSGLPEAPTNMFDDSNRGLSKGAWTFQFPGGADLFAVVLSFVVISTIMFTTTYIVWKVGAIHFNEY